MTNNIVNDVISALERGDDDTELETLMESTGLMKQWLAARLVAIKVNGSPIFEDEHANVRRTRILIFKETVGGT